MAARYFNWLDHLIVIRCRSETSSVTALDQELRVIDFAELARHVSYSLHAGFGRLQPRATTSVVSIVKVDVSCSATDIKSSGFTIHVAGGVVNFTDECTPIDFGFTSSRSFDTAITASCFSSLGFDASHTAGV